MKRPENLKTYPKRDLKLGIKSSLPNPRATIALFILLWELSDKPADLIYADGEAEKLKLKTDLFRKIKALTDQKDILNTRLEEVVNQNNLLTSQLEALIVAFELVWPLGKMEFTDGRTATAERTGGLRFSKKILFTINMDFIDLAFGDGKENLYSVLLNWLGFQEFQTSQNIENRLIKILTLISERAVYKLQDGEKEVIFNNLSMYEKTQSTEEVDIKGDLEAKGSLRILLKELQEKLNTYLLYDGNKLTKNSSTQNELNTYAQRVNTYLLLTNEKEGSNQVENVDNLTDKEEKLIVNELDKDDYTLEELKSLYTEMESKQTVVQDNTTAIPVLFGIKYGYAIRKNNYSASSICRWNVELNHGLKIYDNLVNNTFGVHFYNPDEPISVSTLPEVTSTHATKFINPEQIIYYGVPGSGKSYKVSERLKKEYKITDEDLYVERTVFHPEYTNADFIGQIIPCLNQGRTDFQFTPGPFTSILKKALYDQENQYVLVIEEINRGNAAAIFGEIFQLLDRIKKGETKTELQGESYHNHYGKGWSDYFVMNTEINNYIRDSQDSYDGKALDLNGIHFSGNTGIRLPPNLSILATMNTSDQNVFTLDNAFQRRWDMKIVENVFGDTPEEINQKSAFVDSEKKVTWDKFQSAINVKIGKMSQNTGLSSMEDKRLGCWFVIAEKQPDNSYAITKEVFAEKVLKYLWDDAFKFSREKIFAGYNTLEELTKDFEGTKGLAVFKDLFVEENA